MSMEIRFPATEETPHYLGQIVFSRLLDEVQIEIVDRHNNWKANYIVDRSDFIEAMAALGIVKVIEP